ncbi:MAG TPA: ABC transporter permease [Bauldia sp.]|nr:ABC transporter permease [Bauldia sp.]
MVSLPATAGALPPAARVLRFARRNAAVALIYAITAVFVAVASALSPTFRDFGNLMDILRQSTVLGLATIGQLFVMLAGGIDMSVGMIARVAGLGVAVAMTTPGPPPLLALPLAPLAGALIGLVVARFSAQPFIATLGMMGVLYGIALAISDGPTKMVPLVVLTLYDTAIGPVPAAVVAMAGVWLAAWWVLRATRFGRGVYAVGGSPKVARLAGLGGERIVMATYAISGLVSAAAGVFLIARSGVGNPNMALGLEFQSIVAAAIGGISLYGGRGSVAGAFGAVILISVIANLFDLFQFSAYFQDLALGLIVVAAVAIHRTDKSR